MTRAVDEAAVCAAYVAGEPQRAIAARHGVSQWKVSTVVRRHLGHTNTAERTRRSTVGLRATIVAAQAANIASGKVRIERNGETIQVAIGETTFLLDAADEPLIHQYIWRVSTTGRLMRQCGSRSTGGIRNVYVYHDVLGVAPNQERVVDHINRDVTDNRRCNLRVCTYSENRLNRKPQEGSHGA